MTENYKSTLHKWALVQSMNLPFNINKYIFILKGSFIFCTNAHVYIYTYICIYSLSKNAPISLYANNIRNVCYIRRIQISSWLQYILFQIHDKLRPDHWVKGLSVVGPIDHASPGLQSVGPMGRRISITKARSRYAFLEQQNHGLCECDALPEMSVLIYSYGY